MKYVEIQKWLNSKSFEKKTEDNKNLPKITVITPSYNQGQFLEETILSVLNQGYPNLEYFVFDGGSNDASVEVIRKYEDKIDYWESVKDKGQSDAINKGFRKATGDIICWLNSDDLFMPNVLLQIGQLFLNKDIEFVFGKSYYLFEESKRMMKNNTTDLSNDFKITDCDFIVQPSTFWRKELLDKVGLLDENLHYSFDWYFFIKMIEASKQITKSDEFYSIYRIHGDHKSSSAGQKRIEEIAKIYKIYHNEEVANAYKRINGSPKKILLRRILKRSPKFILAIYWKLFYSKLTFKQFRSITKM